MRMCEKFSSIVNKAKLIRKQTDDAYIPWTKKRDISIEQRSKLNAQDDKMNLRKLARRINPEFVSNKQQSIKVTYNTETIESIANPKPQEISVVNDDGKRKSCRELHDLILKMKTDGKSPAQIAQVTGHDKSTISKYVTKHIKPLLKDIAL